MREYYGLAVNGLVHVVERLVTAYGRGDIGLCTSIWGVVEHRALNNLLGEYVPTCLACIANTQRIREREA